MTYYLLLSGDTKNDYHDTNVLGEESFGKFFIRKRYFFHNIVNNKPELLEDITILDDHKKQYTITEFMDILSKLKIYTN